MESKLCNICQTDRCINVETLKFEDNKKCCIDLGEALWNQQRSGQFCEVFLISGREKIPAHKCVLAVESGYFRSLFAGNFRDASQPEYEIPQTPVNCIQKILKYLYIGRLEMTFEEIESVYMISDYLCVESLICYCQEAMKTTLSCKRCFTILEVSTKYNLTDIQNNVIDFICPFASEFLSDFSQSLNLSHQVLEFLLENNKINYVSESFLLEFLNKRVSPNIDSSQMANLFKQIDPAYLQKQDIISFMQKEYFELYISNEKKVEYMNRLSVERGGDTILCRSRGKSQSDGNVKVLAYNIDEDCWSSQLTPPSEISLNGLESMVKHRDTIYLLTTTTEDMCGYMHTAADAKHFFSVLPGNNKWVKLPSPQKVQVNSRLVSHINGLFVLDKFGVIEMFDELECRWFDVGMPIFNVVPSATLNFIPMPMDRYIYIARIYSLGYSPEYAEFAIGLYLYDTISGTSRQLSYVESSELDLLPEERFHGYVIVPGKIFLKDSVGQTRLEYDITSETWQCKNTEELIPKSFGIVWGTLQNKGKSYMIINSQSSKKQYFLMYDWVKKRYKSLKLPEHCQLSGLMICI